MTYQQAKKLRDLIRADGIKCIVPTGIENGHRYFARTFLTNGKTVDFRSERGYRTYCRKRDEARALFRRWAEEHGFMEGPPRSPLDIMIDRACGLS